MMIADAFQSMNSTAIPVSWYRLLIPMGLMKTVDGVTILK